MILYDQNIWGNTTCPIGNRNILIKTVIGKILPDIICFQECNPRTSRAGETPIQDILKPVYTEAAFEYVDRNFVPVFYNENSVSLSETGFEPFEGRNDAGSKGMTWAAFKEKSSGKNLIVISTHFWFKCVEEEDFLQRVENAKVVCKKAKELAAKYDAPAIIAGDFNSGTESPQGSSGYEAMLENGMKDIRYLARESDSSHTVHRKPEADEKGIYIKSYKPYMTIDYMFALNDSQITLNSFSVLKSKDALLSSDHCPLILDFNL